MSESVGLEGKTGADLDCTRSARTERLVDALRRLAEVACLHSGTRRNRSLLADIARCSAVHHERVAGQIRDIERIEHLAQDADAVALFDGEDLGQAEVLRDERISKLVIPRQNDTGTDGLSLGVLRADDGCIVRIYGVRQIAFAASRVEAAIAYAGNWLVAAGWNRPRQNQARDGGRYRGPADNRQVHAQRK